MYVYIYVRTSLCLFLSPCSCFAFFLGLLRVFVIETLEREEREDRKGQIVLVLAQQYRLRIQLFENDNRLRLAPLKCELDYMFV